MNRSKSCIVFSWIFMLHQQVVKFSGTCMSWSLPKSDLDTNSLNFENRSFENVHFSRQEFQGHPFQRVAHWDRAIILNGKIRSSNPPISLDGCRTNFALKFLMTFESNETMAVIDKHGVSEAASSVMRIWVSEAISSVMQI